MLAVAMLLLCTKLGNNEELALLQTHSSWKDAESSAYKA